MTCAPEITATGQLLRVVPEPVNSGTAARAAAAPTISRACNAGALGRFSLARTQLGPPDLLNEYGASKYLTGGKARSLAVSTAAGAELASFAQDPDE